jgi:hypothetical protein
MKALLCLLACCFVAAAGTPRLFYSKSFPTSKPEYTEVKLERDGKAEYRESPTEEPPLRIQLRADEADAVFVLADKLGHFTRELESGLKVARMGEKTFRWEQDGETHQVKFNYSLDPDAEALHEWFERISESAQRYYELESTVKYDRIGANQALLNLEAAWDKGRLAGINQFLPLLDRVAKNDSYLNMARERAAKLAALFREQLAHPPAPKATQP